MTHVQTMINVIFPQALRNIMPQIGNNLIINIKDTCVLSIIGTVELFYTTKGVAGALYTYFESFTIAMIIVTHEMAFARDVAKHVIFMGDGVIVEEGTSQQIFENPQKELTKEFLSRFRNA